MKTKALKAAFPYTLPVFMGYLFLGIAFGILLTSNGFSLWLAVLMSAVIYAGSGQFLAVSILLSPFNPINAVIMTLSINARHIFYGLSMLEKFKESKKLKPYMVFSLTDETYSLLCQISPPENVSKKWFMFFIALLDHMYWIFGTLIGGLFGSLFKFNSAGIEFAMTALFIVIFIEQWESTKNHFSALMGIVLTTLCLLAFGTKYFIIFSMIGIFICLCAFKKKLCANEVDNK